MSGKLTGAFVGDQFAPVFQSAEPGSSSQVASTASAELGPAVNNSGTNNAPMTVNRTSAIANSPIEVARKRRNLLASLVVIFFAIMVIAVLGCLRISKSVCECGRTVEWDQQSFLSGRESRSPLRNSPRRFKRGKQELTTENGDSACKSDADAQILIRHCQVEFLTSALPLSLVKPVTSKIAG